MDYSSARYSVGLFYARVGLGEANDALEAVGRLVVGFMQDVPWLKVKQKGLLYLDQLKVKALREVSFAPARVSRWVTHLADAREAGIYFYDDGFRRETPPILLCNLHLSAAGTIGGIELREDLAGSAVGSFLIVGLEVSSRVAYNRFTASIQTVFGDLDGIRGYLLRDVPYVFDGVTSLEWAYRNIGAQIRTRCLGDWSMPYPSLL